LFPDFTNSIAARANATATVKDDVLALDFQVRVQRVTIVIEHLVDHDILCGIACMTCSVCVLGTMPWCKSGSNIERVRRTMMDAAEIVRLIGEGVKKALKTNEFFLGVEEFDFENADIHPEYITTVKVGEQLTGVDRVVSLETNMKTLQRQAYMTVRMKALAARSGNPLKRPAPVSNLGIDQVRDKYSFGKKRVDIVVRRSSDPLPMLIAEAKLGSRNIGGIINDIERIVTLLTMYHEFELLSAGDIYGAVVFHVMKEGAAATSVVSKSQTVLIGINNFLAGLSLTHTWLQHKAGLLKSAQIYQPVRGYEEAHEDDQVEQVLGKDQFFFAPGLVLLGNAQDIVHATF
jgi:hypothetical protein